MGQFKDFKTIPQLYSHLVNEFGKTNNKTFLMRKVSGKFEGFTYSDLKIQTENLGGGLASLGIKKNDKIAILSENRPEWVFSDFAILGLGAINVPIYPSLTSESVEYILNNSESKAVILSNKLQLNKILKIKDSCKHLKYIIILNEKDAGSDRKHIFSFKEITEQGAVYNANHKDFFEDGIKKIKGTDVCTIIYTSGTTGEPKGVMLSHNNILSNVNGALNVLPISQSDVFLSFLPLCHIFERMAGYYTAFATGGTIYYAESIDSVAQNMLEVHPTIITTVPRLFERIYSKILKNVEKQPPSKQKIFYWAIETGKLYAQAKKQGSISLALSFKT